MANQQEQTKSFFNRHSSEWQKKANDNVYSVINDRHRATHLTLDQYPIESSLLDVGCGTGQLAIEASERGFSAVGLDFAEEMISMAKKNAIDSNSNASFEVASIFEYNSNNTYDIISAMGFIEYISLEQLQQFLEFCYNNLSSNGAISIGSRNRLFNLTTFNKYTELEKQLGTVDQLITESTVIMSANSNVNFIKKLRDLSKSIDLSQSKAHPKTGIDVDTRYQFTPGDLMNKIEGIGFKVTNIYPVHYHAFNPMIDDDRLLEFRKQVSETISAHHQSDFRYLPNSSSFVIEAKKA